MEPLPCGGRRLRETDLSSFARKTSANCYQAVLPSQPIPRIWRGREPRPVPSEISVSIHDGTPQTVEAVIQAIATLLAYYPHHPITAVIGMGRHEILFKTWHCFLAFLPLCAALWGLAPTERRSRSRTETTRRSHRPRRPPPTTARWLRSSQTSSSLFLNVLLNLRGFFIRPIAGCDV